MDNRVNEAKIIPGQLVFGLDIGTRSLVGTVGYMKDEVFHVVAQTVREHETRSMLDGQIHDIERVSRSIAEVKSDLEAQINRELTEVCIAAAGRVLKTVNTKAETEFSEDTEVEGEDIYALEMAGIEKAYEDFQKTNDTDTKFYCVGYTVVRYFLNDYPIGSLERHKAKRIGVELIATFLPDEVVDGLYKSVEEAGLAVANLTLEPIAAIHVAIPLNFRMLNIALVDVGAGTSDISITNDGSIIAYGMIPMAGDELTEALAKHCLVDFSTAEKIKTAATSGKTITYKDIMGLPQKITPKEVLKVTDPVTKKMTREVALKIKELNGGKPVAAVFVVGGGGKLPSYTDALAKELGIDKTRVALRGEEELKEIVYENGKPNTDTLFVTPIGICLNFYDAKNNFIFVSFNGERVKLYDNGKLLVVDAAMQAGFPNESLFPKRGKELNFTVGDKPYMIRGELGEPAVIKLNGETVSMNEAIKAGDRITVEESTEGVPAHLELMGVPGFNTSIRVNVNDKNIELPRFARVNGELESGYYELKEGDKVELLDYYTVRQVVEFMDVILAEGMNIYVNNKLSDMDTRVYNNFSIIWTLEELELSDVEKYGMGSKDSSMAVSFSDLAEDEDYKTGDSMAPEDVKRPELGGSENKEFVIGRDAPGKEVSKDNREAAPKEENEPSGTEDAIKGSEPEDTIKVSDPEDTINGPDPEDTIMGSEPEDAINGPAPEDIPEVSEEKERKESPREPLAKMVLGDIEEAGSTSEAEGEKEAGTTSEAGVISEAAAISAAGEEDKAAEAGDRVETQAGTVTETGAEIEAGDGTIAEAEETAEAVEEEAEAKAGTGDESGGEEAEAKVGSLAENEAEDDEGEKPLKDGEDIKAEGISEALPEGEAALPEQDKHEQKPSRLRPSPLLSDDGDSVSIAVTVNDSPVILTGKKNYIFVDVFEFYDFDLSTPQGRAVITKLNGKSAPYAAVLNHGDEIRIYWDE